MLHLNLYHHHYTLASLYMDYNHWSAAAEWSHFDMIKEMKLLLFCSWPSSSSLSSHHHYHHHHHNTDISSTFCSSLQCSDHVQSAQFLHEIRPTPKIGTIGLNLAPDSGASFSCRCTTSKSTTLEVVHRHEKLAPESGIEFMATVSGACVRGLRSVFSCHAVNVMMKGDTVVNYDNDDNTLKQWQQTAICSV